MLQMWVASYALEMLLGYMPVCIYIDQILSYPFYMLLFFPNVEEVDE